MPTPVIDLLKDDSDMTMHSHTETDLGAILDARYIKVAGGNSASNIIIENDTLDGDITFKVNDGGVDKTVMTLDGATGRVGIGTTSPGEKLEVNGNIIPATANTGSLGTVSKYWNNLLVNNSTIFGDLSIGGWITLSGGGNITTSSNGNLTLTADGTGDVLVTTDSDTDLSVGNGQLFVQGSIGNVGIGTTSPTYKLDVSGTQRLTVDTGDVFVLNGTNVTGYTDLKFTGHGVDNFIYSFGSSYATSGRYIATSGLFDATGVGGLGLAASNASGVIRLYTNGNNERMRVDNAGNVGIGTTSPGYKLDVVGNIIAGLTGSAEGEGKIIARTIYDYHALGMTAGQQGTADPTYPIAGMYTSYGGAGTFPWGGYGNLIIYGRDGSHGDIVFRTGTGSGRDNRLVIKGGGNVGIGTTSPTRILGIGGLVARNIGMERGTVANTAGFNLTINAGSATTGATDKNGGQLILTPGVSTGSGESGITIQGCVAGASGTADRSMQDMIKVLGNKLAFYNSTPVSKATALTAVDAGVLNTGDATSDAVIGNIRTRLGEIESRLTSYGLLS